MHLRRVALVVIVALWLGVSGSAMAQVRGGTAVIVVEADPGHLNPAISTGSHVHAVADSLYNALIELDRDLKPQPDRARHCAAVQKVVADQLPYWWLTETVATRVWRLRYQGWQP